MTKLLQRLESSLRSLYIFNTKYGKNEGEEHKKILFYHPQDIELNTKIKDVGLSEAIVSFTGTFTAEENCHSLHTQKTTQLFYQPEAGYWMVLTLNAPKEIRTTKENIEVADYRGGEINDRIYHAVLQRFYNTFRLLHGTFAMTMAESAGTGAESEDEARLKLQERLNDFFDIYLPTMKLTACDIMDLWSSIQYLPLDVNLFLRCHNFNNMIMASFHTIKEAILLYNDQVICCGKVHPRDMYSIHEYLLAIWLTPTTPTSMSQSTLSSSTSVAPTDSVSISKHTNSISAEMYRNGAYITGPEKDTEPRSVKPPIVYLQCSGEDYNPGDGRDKRNARKLQPYRLVIYRALHLVLCLFIEDDETDKGNFYNELHIFAGPQLTKISSDIDCVRKSKKALTTSVGGFHSTNSGKATTAMAQATLPPVVNTQLQLQDIDTTDAASPKFIFINELNLKHISNFIIDRQRPRLAVQVIPQNVINLLGNSFRLPEDDNVCPGGDVVDGPSPFEEVQMKTTNDFWIVWRRCNWRQYFVIICNSKATLLDITNESKRIFEQNTNGMYFGN